MPSIPPLLTHLEQRLRDGYTYQFEPIRYLRESVAIFRQFVGGFILFSLAALLVLRIARELPLALFLVVILGLSGCWAGYFWVCRQLAQANKPQLTDFLHAFRPSNLKTWLLLAIIIALPFVIALAIAAYTPVVVDLVVLGMALLVSLLSIFALPLCACYNINPLQALSLSLGLVSKNLLPITFFVLLLIAANLLAIPTIIGLPLSLSLSACAIYSACSHLLAQYAAD